MCMGYGKIEGGEPAYSNRYQYRVRRRVMCQHCVLQARVVGKHLDDALVSQLEKVVS